MSSSAPRAPASVSAGICGAPSAAAAVGAGLAALGAPSPAASIFLKYFWAWLRIWAAVLVVMRSATFFHSRP